jgi:hypothetical protein
LSKKNTPVEPGVRAHREISRKWILSRKPGSTGVFFFDKKQPVLFDYFKKQKENLNKWSKMMPFFIKNRNKMAHF